MNRRVRLLIALPISFCFLAFVTYISWPAKPEAGGPAGSGSSGGNSGGSSGGSSGSAMLPEAQAWPEAGDILLREIARQAVFIAERDGLGLDARDSALGEPAGHTDVTLDVQPRVKLLPFNQGLRLFLIGGAGQEPLWNSTLLADDASADYRLAIEKAEALSRSDLVDASRKAGLKDASHGGSAGGAAAAAVPPAVERQLAEMNIVSQFACIRAAHQALRAAGAGDSPEWLGALVRGYANLGQLTSYLWSASPQVFAARSLLYAQRLAALHPKSADALRHRAYAYALAGFQKLALEDVDAASKLAAAGEKPPAWAELIEPYCRYETSKLGQVTLAATAAASELPLFLCFLTVEHSRSSAIVNGFGELVLRASPENLRVLDKMISRSGVVPNHRHTVASLEVLRLALPARMTGMAGLPEGVRQLITRAGRDPSPAVSASLGQALIDASAGGAPAADAGQPSWAVLGRILQEAQFLAVERRAAFEAFSLGVDPSQFIQQSLPLFQSHPYAGLIRSYALPHQATPQKRALLEHIQPIDGQFKTARLWEALAAVGISAGGNTPGSPLNDWARLAGTNCDVNAIDGEWCLETPSKTFRDHAIEILRKASPHHPAIVASDIENHWDQVAPRLAELEPLWGDHPTILAALAQQYIKLKNWPSAQNVLLRYVAVAPERWGFESLAYTYLQQDDEASWLKTMKQGLAVPDYALDHASINQQIARHYMAKKDFHTAKPYADAAAESYSSFGLLTAAECEEGLGNWQAAEEWVRRNAERYNHPFEWLKWCVRTGHGDRAGAIALGRAKLGDSGGDREQIGDAAAFLLLAGETKEAMSLLSKMIDTNGDPWAGLHLMLLAEAERDVPRRDAAAKIVAERGPSFQLASGTHRPELVRLAALFEDAWTVRTKDLDVEAIHRLVQAAPTEAANINYFTGKFLALRGRAEEAQRFYLLAGAGYKESINRILALVELRSDQPAAEPSKPPAAAAQPTPAGPAKPPPTAATAPSAPVAR
jgi:tetratricopeptide (TPR) repeat protein